MYNSNQSGMSLLSMVMALGIMGVIMAIFIAKSKNDLDVNTIVDNRIAVESMRQLVRVAADCPATMKTAPYPWQSAKQVTIRNSSDKDIFVQPIGFGNKKFNLTAITDEKAGVFNIFYASGISSTANLLFRNAPGFVCAPSL